MTPHLGRRLPLLAHAFSLQTAAYLIRPAAAYRAIELGLAPALVGLIAASFAVIPLVAAVPVGRWTDRGREYPTLVLGGVAMAAAAVGMLLLPTTLWSLVAWNALIGFGHLLAVIGQQSLVAGADRDGLDAAFGLYTFAGSLGQAVAPLLLATVGGGVVIPDSRLLVIAYGLACAMMLVVTPLLRRRIEQESSPTPTPRAQGRVRALPPLSPATRRTMTGGILLSALVLAAVDLIQVYLPALGVERGIDAWVIGVLLTVRAGATMLSRLGLGRLVHRWGRRRLVVGSSILAGVVVAMMALPLPPVLLGLLLALAGFCLGIGQPLSMTIVTLAAPPGTTSTFLALRLVGNRVGQSAVPAALTVVSTVTGTAGIFVLTGVGLLATAGLALASISDSP